MGQYKLIPNKYTENMIMNAPRAFFTLEITLEFSFQLRYIWTFLERVPAVIITPQWPAANNRSINIAVKIFSEADLKTMLRTGAINAKVHGPKPIPITTPNTNIFQ